MHEDNEVKEIYGQQCWCGTEADPGGLKRCGSRSGSTAKLYLLGCAVSLPEREHRYAQSLRHEKTYSAAGLHNGSKELRGCVLHSQ